MLATASVSIPTAPPEVIISHNDEELRFSISRFGRDVFQKNDHDVFEFINKYWADLSIGTQDKIFNIYKEIQQAYDMHFSTQQLTDYITDKVAELFVIHDFNAISTWISFKSEIIIPDNFIADYIEDIDTNLSREKTYTRSDYKNIVALSLAMRCMIPVWGDYINSTRHLTGNEFKEFYAFQLLNKSAIIHSPAISKLKTYIHHLTIDKHSPDNVLKGISSEDFVNWLLSLLCIKRLTIADIRGLSREANVITYIYKFIIQKLQCRDNNAADSYQEKKFTDTGSGNDQGKSSMLEMYKIKTNISPGDIVELQFALNDIVTVAKRLTSQLDMKVLESALETCQVLNKYEITKCQYILLGWVFKPIITPRGLYYIDKKTLVNALGALQAVLWARGHYYLAILATCYYVTTDEDDVMIVSPVDSKMRIPKDLIDAIEQYYPFTLQSSGKKKLEGKQTNICIKEIGEFADDLAAYSWRATASTEYLELALNNASRRIPIKPDIKTYLARLVLSLGKRDWI